MFWRLRAGCQSFIHDEEAHLVAHIEEFRGGGVVAGADGVAAHLFQDFELALEGADVEGGAEGAQVVVIADAVEFGDDAVDGEAGVGVEFERADAEGGFVGVDRFTIFQNADSGYIEPW